MPFLSASLDAFLLTSVALLVAWITLARRRSFQQTPRPEVLYLRFHALLNVFAFLHTISILYVLLLRSPPNIFTRLHIPLTTSSEKIRAILLKYAGPNLGLPKHLETLLTRLSSFDARNIYVR